MLCYGPLSLFLQVFQQEYNVERSLNFLSQRPNFLSDETSLRNASNRKLVREPEVDDSNADESAFVQEEEEPLDFKSIAIRRESLYNHYDKLDELGKGRFGIVFEVLTFQNPNLVIPWKSV